MREEPRSTPLDVYFYVNGMPRLLMSCVIGDELYPHDRKHLILLHQRPHRYDALLPQVQQNFVDLHHLHIAKWGYSHKDQFLNTYFNRYRKLRQLFRPNSEVILFGIATPVQKFIVRHNKALGNTVRLYAGSLLSDQYLVPRKDEWWRKILRRVFARAFEYQHDYDVFYVVDKEAHRDSPWYPKLQTMFDIYGSPSFRKYVGMLTSGLDLKEIAEYDTVFFGQPLSAEGLLTQLEEEAMLRAIIGERRVLILPHPNETAEGETKYAVVPNGRVFRATVPNDLLLLALRPKVTMTYASTIGINYAMMNPESTNYFFPIHRPLYEMLCRYERTLKNVVVSGEFIRKGDPWADRKLVV